MPFVFAPQWHCFYQGEPLRGIEGDGNVISEIRNDSVHCYRRHINSSSSTARKKSKG